MTTKRTSDHQGDPPQREPTPPVDPDTGQPPVDGADSHAAGTDKPEPADVPGSVSAGAHKAKLAPAPYYVAVQPLFIGGNSGTMPVRAFNAGAHVPADLVEPNGWTALVRHPDDPAPAANTDATTAGQE
jgi:hypothetical protein